MALLCGSLSTLIRAGSEIGEASGTGSGRIAAGRRTRMAISVQTQKQLWARSFDVCAFVPCIQPLTLDPSSERSGSVVLGEQAHIRSPKPGGPRHDAQYKRDVDGFENLMLLCPTHHSLIDANNGRNFTVAQLEQMKAQHGRQQEMRSKFAPAISAYLGDRYGEEDLVQFRQAELQGRVDAMFVDVPLGVRGDAPAAPLLRQIAQSHPGDPTAGDVHRGLIVTGAAQALLHPAWTGNAVLVGGPGQGKSTLLQYLSQYYRARRLGKSSYDADDDRLLRFSGPARIPFRIDLRRYAAWVRRLEKRAEAETGDSSLARVDLERFCSTRSRAAQVSTSSLRTTSRACSPQSPFSLPWTVSMRSPMCSSRKNYHPDRSNPRPAGPGVGEPRGARQYPARKLPRRARHLLCATAAPADTRS